MMWRSAWGLLAICLAFSAGLAQQHALVVRDDASLRSALKAAGPGATIRIAPGRYGPGVYVANLKGIEGNPIVIEGANPDSRPIFEAGSTGWHLVDCQYVTLRNIVVRGQTANGINVDDGGSYQTPSHHILLEGIYVTEIGPRGNYDGIKLSGVDDFVVRDCLIEGWGGQAVDMVGCHRGLIDRCRFVGKEEFSQTTGPQTKGGSSQIVIQRCLFRNAGQRAVNIGGSTGLAYFRPRGARYEAQNIVVEGCVFVGSMAPIAYVGVDGAIVRYNTILHPEKWMLRILQETNEPGFVECRNGRFERNLVVFRRRDVTTPVNIGPNTRPETFVFARNFWFCEDRPDASQLRLPTPETGGLYGVDPKLNAAVRSDFRPQESTAAEFGAMAWKPEPATLD